MRLFLSISIILGFILFCNGCTGYGNYMKTTEKFPPTNVKDIKIYSISKPEKDYLVLGYISVYASDAQDAGNDLKYKLKTRAAEIGADAIVAFKLDQAVSGGGGAEGIAVKFK